jgi:hypothetical protein
LRIPISAFKDDDLRNITNFLGESLKIVGNGLNKKVVFRKDQLIRLKENTGNHQVISEASSLVLRAYSNIINSGSSAKSSPQGKLALVSAILAMYNVDPGLATNLTYLLD